MSEVQTALWGPAARFRPPRPAPAPPGPAVQLALLAADVGQFAGQGLLLDHAGALPDRDLAVDDPAAPPPVLCDICSRQLTTRSSIARGRGPVCHANLCRRAGQAYEGLTLDAGMWT